MKLAQAKSHLTCLILLKRHWFSAFRRKWRFELVKVTLEINSSQDSAYRGKIRGSTTSIGASAEKLNFRLVMPIFSKYWLSWYFGELYQCSKEIKLAYHQGGYVVCIGQHVAFWLIFWTMIVSRPSEDDASSCSSSWHPWEVCQKIATSSDNCRLQADVGERYTEFKGDMVIVMITIKVFLSWPLFSCSTWKF